MNSVSNRREEMVFAKPLTPQTLVPSRPRTASSASLVSSNSTKAKPGGFLATQTFFNGPYFPKQSSSSYLLALLPRLPMYTLATWSESRCRDMAASSVQCLKELKLVLVGTRPLNLRELEGAEVSALARRLNSEASSEIF